MASTAGHVVEFDRFIGNKQNWNGSHMFDVAGVVPI